MSGRTINSAIVLLVIGNFLAIISDSIIKWQGGDVPIFQFVLLRVFCTLALLLPFLGMIDRGRLFEGTKIHLIRAHVGLAGVLCMIVALNSLPLATANAIFYAAPVLVMVFGVWFFGERLSWLSFFAVVSGFLGIVVILRPVELSWESLSALGLAFALAINALLVRKLPKGQTMAHTLLLTHLYVIPAATVLALVEGAPFDPTLLGTAFASSFFILGYNITVLLAYRHVSANQVTSAEYTGLIWAMLIGWVWFAEVPDIWFYLGSAMIVVPIILQSLEEKRRLRVIRKTCEAGS
ncbi:drug/metabolite transporter (DMT)-like permease [Natronospira proteinivora]|uniref:Drug/metabolite transporter (DMT)-like permease n=1 Tax=Natronospira proteinivora TaxID=1807133 RepID=A0ABT1G7C1_9GAMM|nr:DMT family transporter [Natronospira proteinivora]MCP1727198.1 drug/metabolite transporter (DMT)-like permease [Natronospira proteinivora]